MGFKYILLISFLLNLMVFTQFVAHAEKDVEQRSSVVQIQNSNQCSLKPMAKVGCVVGKCINGYWEQICSSPEMECGFKPIPNVGCELKDCVNGEWVQTCNIKPLYECGFKPMPLAGCKIGKCINGAWEQICK